MVDSITEILQKIERGELSAQEGLRLLNELENLQPEATASETVDPSKVDVIIDNPARTRQDDEEKGRLSEEALERELGGWKRWWTIPFWIGVAISSKTQLYVHVTEDEEDVQVYIG
jgi:polyhydroxyalkanoate synthesis regulator phasin